MPALDLLEIPDLLANLVERSLVVFDPSANRYHLTESMRAYALDQLGAEEPDLRRRHFQYFSNLAEAFRLFGLGGDDRALIKVFLGDIDNLRGAQNWASTNDPEGHLRLAANASPAWGRTHTREGMQNLFNALEAAPDAVDADHIWARSSLAHIKLRVGELEDVEALLDTVMRQLDIVDIPLVRATTLLRKAWYATWTGNLEAIRPLCGEAIEVCTRHNLKFPLSVVHLHLGDFARMQGHWDEARRSYEAALEYAPEDGVLQMVISFNLGGTAIQSDQIERAEGWYRETIRLSRNLFDGADETANAYDGALGLGYVALKQSHFRLGGLLIGNAESRLRSFGISLDPLDLSLFEKMVALGRETGGEAFNAGLVEGPRLSQDQVREMIGE